MGATAEAIWTCTGIALCCFGHPVVGGLLIVVTILDAVARLK